MLLLCKTVNLRDKSEYTVFRMMINTHFCFDKMVRFYKVICFFPYHNPRIQKDIDISEKVFVSENFSIDIFMREASGEEKETKLEEHRDRIKEILKRKPEENAKGALKESKEKTGNEEISKCKKEEMSGGEEKGDRGDFAINDEEKGDSISSPEPPKKRELSHLEKPKDETRRESSTEDFSKSPSDQKSNLIQEIIASSKKEEEKEESGSEEEDLDDEEYFKSLENS